MNAGQLEVLRRVRRTLGDDAADRLEATWQADGVGADGEPAPSAGTIAQLAAWRFDCNPYRRAIAEQRLTRLGYELHLNRRVTEADARRARLEGGGAAP